MKYSPPPGGVESFLDEFTAMVTGYFQAGGMQVQYNIRDYKDFIKAQKRPDKYPDLIVRVSGYSAYFNDLNETMQQEVITRTQYKMPEFTADPFPEDYEDMLPFK